MEKDQQSVNEMLSVQEAHFSFSEQERVEAQLISLQILADEVLMDEIVRAERSESSER